MRATRRLALLGATTALLLSGTGLANADTIHDDLAASGPTSLTLDGGTATTTIKYFVNAANDCDITSQTGPSVWKVNISGGGVIADPAEVSFSACETPVSVKFTATSAGSHSVTLSYDRGPTLGSNPQNPAAFTLNVSAASNTAPVVSIGGVTQGASYEFGFVPPATCSVLDAEDGNSSPDPTLSDITGSLAEYGLGSQTATCSYTDEGGITRSASATYSITDTTRPTLDTPGDMTLEATGPNGAEATWGAPSGSDNVALQGPATCDVASPHTFDLGENTVQCSVTDVAGNKTTGSFKITVTDHTAPSLTVSSDITKEATGPGGTEVKYDDPIASDLHDGTVPASCSPASGSTFPLSDTSVDCSATDNSGNTSTGGFTVHVVDTTAPALSVPEDMTVEATSPRGASVSFGVTASDLVDGDTDVSCDHSSGDTFGFGTTTVNCSSKDGHGNTGYGFFKITVQDTTPPTIEDHADVTAEATGPDGAAVTYSKPGATDVASTTVGMDCIPESGTVFDLGSTRVNCTATDEHGNSAESHFDVIVQDTTPPAITVPDDKTVEATGPSGAVVSFDPSATDVVDGNTAVDCTPASGSTFPLGDTTVNCSSTDEHANTSHASFKVTVQDTMPPTLHLPSDIVKQAASSAGSVVTYTATATDTVDTSVDANCTPASGSTFAPGTTTVNCSATDDSGNNAIGSFTVTVNFGWNGFFAPVDNSGVLNTIKGGQSVPLKWSMPDGNGGWISSLSVVTSVKQAEFTCNAGTPTDDVETTSTGGTSLRYDSTANQYIYNWQSPKTTQKCYQVKVTLSDGTNHTALFKTK